MECDHPLGEKGLHVVDTLGFRAGRKAEEITKEFLTKTDALLFVIRAHPLFEEEDEGFLKMQLRLNESRLEHIFFVINDFSGLNETERLQVRENARTRLRDYFLTPEGDLDESLFARRVFIVDARAALRAQVNGEAGDTLEATGLPDLERGIQQMLDDEKLLPMVLEGTTTQVLIPALEETSRSIQQEKGLLSKDLSELERTQHEVERRLAELSSQADSIQDTFNAFAQKIGNRAAEHFESYTTRTMDEWKKVWEAMGIEAAFRKYSVSAALAKEHRKYVVAQIEERFRSYFATHMATWESEVLEHLESDMVEMSAELEEKVQDFVLGLDRTQASMMDQEIPEILYMDQRLVNKATGIFTSGLDSNLISKRLMRASVKGTILHSIPPIASFSIGLIVIALTSVTALFPMVLLPAVPTAILFVLGLSAKLPESVFNRMRDAISKALREELSNSMPTMKSDIKTSINEHFKRYAEKPLGALQAEIEQVRAQLESTVSKKRAGDARVDAEISRLDVIAAHLDRLFKQISHEVYGRVLTEEEYERLCQGNTILSENA
jgi:peptidoglycan hydrolase CwlO-like protein